MDVVDMAIHPVVCQKSDFHRNSDFQNSKKLDTLQITAEKLRLEYGNLSKTFWCKKLTQGAYKSRISYNNSIWFV
jgi:hypothetical protein